MDKTIYNTAPQVCNQFFCWLATPPNGGATPPEPVLKRIASTFGSLDSFRDKFVDAAVAQFGSGWAWLVSRQGKLEIVTTPDADNPLTSNAHALWTCDVWEHAYYLDYQQERAQFVKAVLENVANWQFVGKQLALSDR
jgi:Fe-Mn family superoxide dismutase